VGTPYLRGFIRRGVWVRLGRRARRRNGIAHELSFEKFVSSRRKLQTQAVLC